MSCGVGRRHGLDLMLLWLWLWHRPGATALIWPTSLGISICWRCGPKTHTHTHTHTHKRHSHVQQVSRRNRNISGSQIVHCTTQDDLSFLDHFQVLEQFCYQFWVIHVALKLLSVADLYSELCSQIHVSFRPGKTPWPTISLTLIVELPYPLIL